MTAMQLSGPGGQPVREELDVMCELLPLDGARVLELGCGLALRTQEIAEQTGVAAVLAAEVDPIAHANNLEKSIPGVTFASFGAEAIDAQDESVDIVVMLKSLHHVPAAQLDDALREIHRVLKPGGLAYVSEPVFAGALNEVIRMFHDEKRVRSLAFAALQRAVGDGLFELAREYFYLSLVTMRSFEQFKAGVMEATHTEHRLSDELVTRVQAQFESCKGEDPTAPYRFETPNRVDLLRKPA